MTDPDDTERAASVEQLAEQLAGRFVDVTHDSRQVEPGWLFACVPGELHDGHDFAASAIERGATGLIVERLLDPGELGRTGGAIEPGGAVDGPQQIVVSDVRAAIGPIAAAIHGRPSSKLCVVGLTGTNGKTTTTHVLTDILNGLGRNTRQIGTLSGERTTPEAADLQRMFADFVVDGVDTVVMEVSSHALALDRVNGSRFELAVFTNLGHDHLDLHGDLDSYYSAKASLFDPSLSAQGLVNGDDPYGRRLAEESSIPVEQYSVEALDEVEVGVDRLGFVWRGHRARLGFGGEFNLSNAVAAMESARLLGHRPSEIADALSFARPVPGRFEPVNSSRPDEPTVIVDYAHTPDGLARLLSSTRTLRPEARIVLTFGCGGDRDQDKRPLMGATANDGADIVVLTSDNPRTEDPDAIIADIAGGVGEPRAELIVEPERTSAIQRSLELARPGDIVLIAGKGHEKFQAVGDQLIPFDDRAVAEAALESTR